jgi:hypothetical protein
MNSSWKTTAAGFVAALGSALLSLDAPFNHIGQAILAVGALFGFGAAADHTNLPDTK